MKMLANQEGSVLLIFLVGIFIFLIFIIEIMYQDLLWIENQMSMEKEEYLNNLLESGYTLAIAELDKMDIENQNTPEIKTIHYDNVTYRIEFIPSSTSTTDDAIMDIIVSMPYLTKKYLKVNLNYINRSIISWEELFSS